MESFLNTWATTTDLFGRLPRRMWKQTEGRMATTGLLGNPGEEGSVANQAALVEMEKVWPAEGQPGSSR